MARPELPLDPSKGPLQHFAGDLRQLRYVAGSPSYRKMAAGAFRSSSSFSEAAAGKHLPSREVTLEYVRACGGEEEVWGRRWDDLSLTLQQASDPESLTPFPASDAASTEPSDPPSTRVTRPGRRRLYYWPVVGTIALAAVITTGGFIADKVTSPSDDEGTRTAGLAGARSVPSPGDPSTRGNTPVGTPLAPGKIDGADPRNSGCARDGMTLGQTPVIAPGNRLVGQLELRYSPSCRAAWGRFSPSPALDLAEPRPLISITVSRPADEAAQNFKVTFDRQAAFGGMLRVTPGCVVAEVEISPGAIAGTAAPASGEHAPNNADETRAATDCLP